jgi:hypothetical protein
LGVVLALRTVGAKIWRRAQKRLVKLQKRRIYILAQIARACGRVSVGGDPDKRPVNRSTKPAAGGEPANPAKRGTRLKATTDRAFSSLSAPPKAGVPKRLVSLAGRADRVSPIQAMATKDRIGVSHSG